MSSYDCWAVSDAVLGVSRRILFHGPPGTGKTYAAVHRAIPEGGKVYSLTMTEETPMAEIRGHFVQKDGSFVWMDGPAVRAWKEGARLVINEIDRASDDVLSFLYAIMDDPDFAEVTLPTGETISPVKGFQLVATMNGEPDDLPDALQDRLPVAINITDLNPAALQRLPEDLQEPARNTTLLKNKARSLSIRAWLEFATLRERFTEKMGAKDGVLMAAHAVFGERGDEALLALNVASEASEAFTASVIPPDLKGRATMIVSEIEEVRKSHDYPFHTAISYTEMPVAYTDAINHIFAKYELLFDQKIEIDLDSLTHSSRTGGSELAFRFATPETGWSLWHYFDGEVI